MKVLGAQVSKLQSSSSRQETWLQQNTSMRPLERAKRVQKLMEEYYPLCCGDHFTMKFLCDVDTDMILDRYIKLRGYIASSTRNRATLRALVDGGVRLPWIEDTSTFQVHLDHEMAKMVSRQAAVVAKKVQDEMRAGLRWFGGKRQHGVCTGKNCRNLPSSTCSMHCCRRCCKDPRCPRHGRKKR